MTQTITIAPGHPLRMHDDHRSPRGTLYSRAGDIVEFIKEVPGGNLHPTIWIYQDASGEKFSAVEDLFVIAHPAAKLKKQPKPSK